MMNPKTKKALLVIAALSALLAALCGYKIINAKQEYAKSRKEYDDLKNVVTVIEPAEEESIDDGYLHLDYVKLKEMNPDFKGWIDIPNTGISYPIVQNTDNDYYLRRTFEGAGNMSGVIFIDYRSDGDFKGQNTIVYGHRMRDGSMFGSLKEYADSAFYAEHDIVHIYTEEAILEYTVFSASEVTTGCDCFTFAFTSDYEFNEWLTRQTYRSIYDTGILPEATDKVITLVTCTGKDEWRYVVQAVLTSQIPNKTN